MNGTSTSFHRERDQIVEVPSIKTTRLRIAKKRNFELSLATSLVVGVTVFLVATALGVISLANVGFYALGLGTMFVLSIQARNSGHVYRPYLPRFSNQNKRG